jgi:hypothetical protein
LSLGSLCSENKLGLAIVAQQTLFSEQASPKLRQKLVCSPNQFYPGAVSSMKLPGKHLKEEKRPQRISAWERAFFVVQM